MVRDKTGIISPPTLEKKESQKKKDVCGEERKK
jgi:hypothetical protein